MAKIKIHLKDWHFALVKAIRESSPDDVIVVDSEDKRTLAERVAKRLDKNVTIEVG